MKQRLLQLEPRQQLVAAGAAALATALVMTVLLVQLHVSRHEARQQLVQAASELAQIESLAKQFAQMHASDEGTSGETVDLTAVVSRSLQSFGLQPTRIQQGSADELQLRLDAVPYVDAIAWLAALEQNGMVVLLRATFTQGPNESTNLTVNLKKRS